MKIFVGLFLVLFFASNLFAMPLVYKGTKEIKDWANEPLYIFDSAKYKDVRVGVKLISGNLSKTETYDFFIYGSDGEDEYFISNFFLTEDFRNRSVEIGKTPNALKIKAKQNGIFKIVIWAQ